MDLSPPGGVDGLDDSDRFLAYLSLEALPLAFLVLLSCVLLLEELEDSSFPKPPRDGIGNHLFEQGYIYRRFVASIRLYLHSQQ
jgi:hypothetical protein